MVKIAPTGPTRSSSFNYSSSPHGCAVVLLLRSFNFALHGRSAALLEEVAWGTFLTSCERRFGISLPKGSDFLTRLQ